MNIAGLTQEDIKKAIIYKYGSIDNFAYQSGQSRQNIYSKIKTKSLKFISELISIGVDFSPFLPPDILHNISTIQLKKQESLLENNLISLENGISILKEKSNDTREQKEIIDKKIIALQEKIIYLQDENKILIAELNALKKKYNVR